MLKIGRKDYFFVETGRTKFLAKFNLPWYIFLMLKTKKQLYYCGDIQKFKAKLNVFVIEIDRNKDVAFLLNNKWNVIWYISKIDENKILNNKYLKIADVARSEIYIDKNSCIEEILYYLINISDVVVVGRVNKIKEALDLIDIALSKGKEIICIKNSSYIANKLISDGANGV